MRRHPDFRARQKIDDYELEEPLGAGQDGEVWCARKLDIGKRCALKFLNKIDDANKLQRFEREIAILASLNNPHVVSIQHRGKAWNPTTGLTVPYYVMEFIPGLPIKDAISSLPTDDRYSAICTLFHQVFSALDEIHRLGLSHGDIKSANILVLSRQRIAKLSDFGFGLLPGESRDRDEYPSSSYKAPPQFTPQEADLYKIGRTIEHCMESLPEAVPGIARTALKELVTDLITEPPRIDLSEGMQHLSQIEKMPFVTNLFYEEISEAVPELGQMPNLGLLLRDPVHGEIPLSRRLRAMIDLEPFQRLRFVRAFPTVDIVYPAATVTLFEQAIGEYAALRLALLSFLKVRDIRDAVAAPHLSAVLLASLLRRALQVPFETQLRSLLNHQLFSQRIAIAIKHAPLCDIIESHWNLDIQLVDDILTAPPDKLKTPAWRLVSWLIEHPLAPPNCDWILRLAMRCGFPQFPDHLRNLYAGLTLSPDGEQLLVKNSALQFLEEVLRYRYFVGERTFWHHTIKGAELMLETAFTELAEKGFNLSTLFSLSDVEFLSACIDASDKLSATTASYLIRAYKDRRLFKRIATIDFSGDHPSVPSRWPLSKEETHSLAFEIASHLGLNVEPIPILIGQPSVLSTPIKMSVLCGNRILPAETVSPIIAAVLQQARALNEKLIVYWSPDLQEIPTDTPGRIVHLIDEILMGG